MYQIVHSIAVNSKNNPSPITLSKSSPLPSWSKTKPCQYRRMPSAAAKKRKTEQKFRIFLTTVRMSSFQWSSSLIRDSEVERLVSQRSVVDDGLAEFQEFFPRIPVMLPDDELKYQARLSAYQELLLRMFGSSFECVPINGGFSGSSVVRITPFDSLGNREESVIVKLDTSANIKAEVAHSLQAHRALGDAAARILGVPVFILNEADGNEYGAFKMELAGACWHVPEFANSSGSLINTFRDIALFESEEPCLSQLADCMRWEEGRPFGSVETVVKDLFGQDRGPTRSLRRYEGSGEGGDRRISQTDPNQPTGADLLKSRLPLALPSVAATQAVVDLITHDPLDLWSTVNTVLASVHSALTRIPPDWKLMRGFCHGDLNGSNILIDSMDGMWLIDFANANKLPLSSDLAKFETCFLFEYCFIPVPADLLPKLPVTTNLLADWFRVPENLMKELLIELENACITEESLTERILQVCESDAKSARRLRARLRAGGSLDESMHAVVRLCECLVPKSGCTANACSTDVASFKWGIEHVLRMREFFCSDIRNSVWAKSSVLFNYDVSEVEFSVLLIRELARCVRFEDIPPWTKVVACKYMQSLGLSLVAEVDKLGPVLKEVRLQQLNLNLPVVNAQLTSFDLAEEKRKYEKFIKARYGFITDFVSGKQLDVLADCCPFRLDCESQIAGALTLEHLLDLHAVENLGFVVGGIGGSGKTCLLRRLAVCNLSNSEIVPIVISVSEWVKLVVSAPHISLDSWLAAAFADNPPRLAFLRALVAERRVLLLLDGVDDAGIHLEGVLDCLKPGIRFVATCKTGVEIPGSVSAEIAPMDSDQRRFVVRSRLGVERDLRSKFETFFDSFEKSFQDDLSNVALVKSPAFLSMLICYWLNTHSAPAVAQTNTHSADAGTPPLLDLHRQLTQENPSRTTSPVFAGKDTVADVYRVALSVMVHRYQVFQQSDRSRVRESSKRVLDLLRQISFGAKLDKIEEFSNKEVLRYLKSDVSAARIWETLAGHVREGKFLLLAFSGGKYQFSISGLSDFLAAEWLMTEGGDLLPDLEELVEDRWWSWCLSILADKSPEKLAKIVERKIGKAATTYTACTTACTLVHATVPTPTACTHATVPTTCMHIAATVGAVWLFKLLPHSPILTALVNTPNPQSLLPLHEAAKHGHATVCRLLIAANSDVWRPTELGWYPLHFAASSHNREVCAILLEQSSSVTVHHLGRLSELGGSLGSRILAKSINSAEFMREVKLVFPELSYFRGRSDTTPDASASVSLEPWEIEFRRTLGAMLSVFYVCGDHYEEFVSSQTDKLSPASWAEIRNWATRVLTSAEAVDAMLSLMAIHDLGKLKDFRNDLAPDFKDHDAAMRFIIGTTPEVLPSLCRLPPDFQYLVKSTLSLDFNFGQFLQAENLPANLLPVQELIGSRGSGALGFYLFHIFADMAGIMGAKSLKGSLFMTETMYSNFALGISALSRLADEGVGSVYASFLHQREIQIRQPHVSPPAIDSVRTALVRLACQARVFEPAGAALVSEAFSQLAPPVQSLLTDHLSRDGISHRAFLIYYAPAFMENCKANNLLRVGMEFLGKIYQAAESEFAAADDQSSGVIVVHIAEAAELAKKSTILGEKENIFQGVKFRIVRSTGSRSSTEGTLRIAPWRVSSSVRGELGVRNLFSLSEPEFLASIPEVQYFEEVSPGRKFPLLSLHRLVCDGYESFARSQPSEDRLSRRSWTELREWFGENGCHLAALMAILAVFHVGSIDRLREDLEIPDFPALEATVEIVSKWPSVVPTLSRLTSAEQEKVVWFLDISKVNFAAILLGELLPANLDVLQNLSDSDLRFFVLASLLLDPQILLTEGAFTAAKSLLSTNIAGYYHARASSLGLNSANTSLVRIACLATVYYPTGGSAVKECWSHLPVECRERLSAFLNTQNSHTAGLSEFIRACKRNSNIGLDVALRLMADAGTDVNSLWAKASTFSFDS